MKRYYYAFNFALLFICSSYSFAALSDEKKTSVSSEIAEIGVVKKSSLAPETMHILAAFAVSNAPIEGDFIKSLLSRLNTLLKDEKASPEVVETKNIASSFTLFHAATLHRMPTLIEKLIYNKVVNTRVDDWIPRFQREPLKNITALHIAAYQADFPTVSVILGMKNARRNPVNSKKETPLHMLTQILPSLTDTTEITKLMIKKGCCLDRKNISGQTPTDMAVNRSLQSQALFQKTQCKCNTCKKKKTSSRSRQNKNRQQQGILLLSSTSSDNNACSSSTSRKK